MEPSFVRFSIATNEVVPECKEKRLGNNPHNLLLGSPVADVVEKYPRIQKEVAVEGVYQPKLYPTNGYQVYLRSRGQ